MFRNRIHINSLGLDRHLGAVLVGVAAENTDTADLRADICIHLPSHGRQALANLASASEKPLAAFQDQVANLTVPQPAVAARAAQGRSKIRVNVNTDKKYANLRNKDRSRSGLGTDHLDCCAHRSHSGILMIAVP